MRIFKKYSTLLQRSSLSPLLCAAVLTYMMTCTLHDNPGNMTLQFLIWTILSFRASKKREKKLIAFYTHIFTIFDAFVSFPWSECPSDVISLQPKELTLVLFLVWLAADESSVFNWKCLFFFFAFNFEWCFTGYRIEVCSCFSLQHFKDTILLSSGEVSCHSYRSTV